MPQLDFDSQSSIADYDVAGALDTDSEDCVAALLAALRKLLALRVHLCRSLWLGLELRILLSGRRW